ncbi:hypothetical protein NCC49_000087 [Naganishia albida]|nr:hypothetical protein NCC49_000087 [Naganishia albida]
MCRFPQRGSRNRGRSRSSRGKNESGSSTDVSVLNSQNLAPPQQETTAQHDINTSKPPTPPLLSPPLVPLTTSDPLLDDRLRSLEAIRSVLGDEVARRLPSVESLRALSAQQQVADEGEVAMLPESTRELLGELDRPPLQQPSAEAVPESTRSASQQRESRDRRSSLRNFTNRLGGWLGVGTGRSEGVPEADGMEVDSAERANESRPAEGETVQEPETAGEASTSTPAAAGAPPTRLAQGAVMIVQGFVQTTVPPRERRRSRPTPTTSSSTSHPHSTTTSRLGMRRTMSQPGPSSAGSSISTNGVSALLRSPPSATSEGRDSSGLASGMEVDTGRWAEPPVASGSRLDEALPPDSEGHGVTASAREGGTARDEPEGEGRRGREGRSEPPSFAEQARMLGGLLSVATAATATSLLGQGTQPTTSDTPAATSAPTRSNGPRAALEALRNRLRSRSSSTEPEGGPPVPDRGVEDVLREYMRHAMAHSRRHASRSGTAVGEGPGPSLSTILPTTDPESFEAFLNDMQTSLIQALTVFAGERDEEREQGVVTPGSGAEATTAQTVETPAAAEDEVSEQAPASSNTSPAEPRRLNFFRIFQFPARPNPPAQPSDPAVDLIPVVIVGVRSMTRIISTVTAENVAAAPFPFNHTDNIQGVPPGAEEGSAAAQDTEAPAGEQTAMEPTEPSSSASTGSWGSRALRSINRLRRPRAARTTAGATEADDDEFTRNYVLWVVGGNYPTGHPILTMPHLFTGELSHEDLWQVVAQIACFLADIENSGLAVIKGSQVKDEGASGAILAICVEQCLICLAAYEDEAENEVRVMKCKHAFHRSCVDEWMVVGRNSCPACRQTGVETASAREAAARTAEAPASTGNEDVNMAA